VAALNQCLLPTFVKGGCSVLMPSWDVDRCFDLIERHGVTWMFGVTTMFAGLAQSPRFASADLSSVRNMMVGGAAVPSALTRAYLERGLTFCQGYGMTETSPGATFLEAPESAAHVGSAGVPVMFADVRCVTPELTPVAVGEPGEVQVRGPNVSPGYWRDPRATAQAFTSDGWLRTGDIAVLDADGHYFIVDRLKDMFVSGGENVYPAEVESVLYQLPAVSEAAVIGIADDRWGETGLAIVALKAGQSCDEATILAHCRKNLARFKCPSQVRFTEALPRNATGKVHKPTLRKEFGVSGAPSAAAG